MPDLYQVFVLSADYGAFVVSGEVLKAILSSIFSI